MSTTPSTPQAAPGRDLLAAVLRDPPEAFALLHRPHSGPGPDRVEVLTGTAAAVPRLADLPLPPLEGPGRARHDVVAVVPYRQLAERGFACVDDGAPLIALQVADQQEVALEEVLARVGDSGITLADGGFDIGDEDYAAVARDIINGEIGRGEGANFVLKRTFVAHIEDYSPASALTLFRRLLAQESGAYWTFAVHTPYGAFVGASPELHVSVDGGTARMNPISGTYRFPGTGPTLDGVLGFLNDAKETDELYMVVDEELKMMARVCDTVPRVVGPRLREMARLAHTEYVIEGSTRRDPRQVLGETLFAPTVTGSPLESACRVIARHEPGGRGHYSGVLALLGRDAAGARSLDSAIMIRTAEISPEGRARIGVGATLVRHSDPAAEAAETRAKAAGMIAALEGTPRSVGDHPQVRAALRRRNERVSDFWLGAAGAAAERPFAGLDVLVVDAEDTFTAMLAHQLRALGPRVEVCRFDEDPCLDGRGLVVMGPGPGDPRDLGDPKIAALRAGLRRLLADRRPFLAVCLSHQVLSQELGLEVVRRPAPNQGAQHTIDLFGSTERVGFYNTFSARSAEDVLAPALAAGPVEVSRDPWTGEVHALRGTGFASMQFHPESLLTRDGVDILGRMLAGVLAPVATEVG
ncbi:anthranilate synthase family protein [Streptomonospora nanhaiensis]|uniref:anthranilate synthase family protein n=1 Tax=Streptomonospora nanhaiensis TaxID=1323731 RepID=UPI001C9A0B0E|nr:anthranilate synthase family protein [Streptomonospora nanhaiensis]MBX9390065.1 anthranilate synthase family protein [Streptomonospora nanhaiensis]